MFVSHNLAAVENLCRRAIWIDGGFIRQDGDPKSVIGRYLSTFAQAVATSYALQDIKRRGCTEEVRFMQMGLVDDEGGPKHVVRSGDSVTVRMRYEIRQRVRHPHFGIEIYTDTGTMVTSMNTWMTGSDIPQLNPGRGRLDLRIDCLNLMPGRYYLSLWIKTLGGVTHDLLDHCAIVDVEASDFYNSGREFDRRFGVFLLPCRWNLEALQESETLRAEQSPT